MNPSCKLRFMGLRSFFSTSIVCLTLAFGLGTTLAWAQATSTSTVTGQVVDQQGAAVPGAQVKLIDAATSTELTTLTNTDGRYVFTNVQPATYNLTFSKTGFSLSRVQQQVVEVGTTLTVNAALQVGATTTTVEVQAQAAAELQTTSASVGTTLSNKAIMALPNLGRDVSTLAVLQPGVTLGGYTAGAVQDQNTYTLDGGNNTDDMAGNNTSYVTNFTGLGGTQTGGTPSGVVPTSVETIEEIKVTTFNQTADFNSSMGSQVQMVTKRGQNQFHGAAYGYYYATNLGAANTWINNHTPDPLLGLAYTPLPSNHRDRWGGSLGGPFAPHFAGGKWYFFFNYEGSRFPNVGTYERTVPTALFKAGVIQLPNTAGVYTAYNINPYPVTVGGVTYQPATCGSTAAPVTCDPRGIGINPVVSKIWNNQMPLPNDPLSGDNYNTQGYLSTIRAPLTEDTYTGRIDHDFSEKYHFMSSYRTMREVNLTTNQVDIGGVLPGDTLGQPAAVAPRDQVPSYWVAGLTTTLSPTATNNFVYNYTRNFWQWGSVNAPPQLPGLGGALEIGGESTNALIPYNVNTQSVRQRFWDGKDNLYKDDLTMIKGNHILQFGGSYQRNFDYHSRTDNGNGINNAFVYQITSSGLAFGNTTNSPYFPTTLAANQASNYQTLYSEVLGLVSQPQVSYTRAGTNLALQPVGSSAYDQSIIPSYNFYFTDTWHMRKNLTVTYGLGYAIEMPPYELNGKQVMLVDQSGNPVTTVDYLAQRKAAALNGQAYDPTLGFETVRNVGAGRKYPYNPVYDEFSPRVAVAWNPKYSSGILGSMFGDGQTVIRAGYGRIFGRLNGVDLVLVPLLGVGLLQPVTCPGAVAPQFAVNGNQCLGTGVATPATAFRIGTDGNVAPLPAVSQTLAQPYFPGINGAASAGDVNTLDPNYRPERTDNFTFSIQRALGTKMTLEAGYIGRIINNEQAEVNLDAVPYMTTLGGQTFAQAYANTYLALYGPAYSLSNASTAAAGSVPTQPFFEAALGGTSSAYCKGYASCTAAVASKNVSLFRTTAVSQIWSAMNASPSWTLGRTMIDANPTQMTSIGMETALGYGNYNALFVTYRARDFHGLTTTSNFTWGRALGTGATTQASSALTVVDPWNMSASYGPNPYDVKFIYNLAMTYQPPFYKTQHGIVGHILGGWTISPLFTAQSGSILGVGYTEGSGGTSEGFGEATPPASISVETYQGVETAMYASPYTGGTSAHYNNAGVTVNGVGYGTTSPSYVNMYSNPQAIYSEFRPCILGYDTSCGGYGNVRGEPTWNLDATVLKDIGIWKEGRVGATLSFQFTNLLNHMAPGSPSLVLSSPQFFGRITGQSNIPRQMEFGMRIFF